MLDRVERPRVLALVVGVVLLAVLVGAGTGVLVGRSSLGDRPTRAQLERATSAEKSTRRQLSSAMSELITVKDRSVARITELKGAVKRTRSRGKAWRRRAKRAERRLRER